MSASDLPTHVTEELRSLWVRLSCCIPELWERQFPDSFRDRFPGQPANAGELAVRFAELRGWSNYDAFAELAYLAGLIPPGNRDWVRRELGDEVAPPPAVEHPTWHADRGELCWGMRLLRKVRLNQQKSRLAIMLDAFEEAGWPSSILNPLKCNGETTRRVVYDLNCGLAGIRFGSAKAGTRITWSHAKISKPNATKAQ